jgi:hypothetical protein
VPTHSNTGSLLSILLHITQQRLIGIRNISNNTIDCIQ